MHSNREMLVNLVPANRWRAEEGLKLIWGNNTSLHFGNSIHQFRWFPSAKQATLIEVPGLQGLPAQLHAINRGNQPRLGPIVAVLISEYLGGAKPFGVQTLLLQELVTCARERGVMVYIITPEAALAQNTMEGYSLVGENWVNEALPYPDFVYNRYFGHHYSQRDQMIKKLSARGARLVNSSLPNKWDCYLWLKTNPALTPHLPETRLYKSINDIKTMLARYSEIYLKPRAGYHGNGIVRLSKSGAAYLLITSSGQSRKLFSLDKLPSYIRPNTYIVQQGIRLWNYPRFYDLKVLVQNTGPHFVVTGKVARQAEPGRVTTHLHQGGEALLISDYIRKLPPAWKDRVEPAIEEVALQTAKVLASRMSRLGEFSIDMGLDITGQVWIIEVNGKPSRKSFRVAGDLQARSDGYENLINYILYDYLYK